MNCDVYSFILHLCCMILALSVIFLAVRLKRLKAKVKENRNVEALTVEEKVLFERIEDGLKNGEFKMYLQCIVGNKDKKIVSAEALSRWETPSGEVLAPVKYIGLMEKMGLIPDLDYYMFEMACRKLTEWAGTEHDSLTLSCNFTRITISQKDFPERIMEIADRYSFKRWKLLIEITEDSMENNMEMAKRNIHFAKELGFRIALDDIGNGYTSLMNLCEYPIDVVKIDRDVLLMTGKERGKKLFFGILSLAHSMNMTVVCEGVETEEQNMLVSESDCDYIQGWYYSKPLPEDDAESFVSEYNNR